VAKEDSEVHHVFKEMIHGGKVEEGLEYNSHSRTYQVK